MPRKFPHSLRPWACLNQKGASHMINLFGKTKKTPGLTFVIGATGKTGSRVMKRLQEKGVPVRAGSRSAIPSFDWSNEATWDASLDGVEAVYISYAGDLAVPGSTDTIQAFVNKAKKLGVKRAVILSGRGEPEAQASEKIVQESGLEWTVVRASWFHQNFSEGAFADMVNSGQITLPIGDVLEPFVDVDDIGDVASLALTEEGHHGEVYEVTGPRLMSFADIAHDLSEATGREIKFVQIPHDAFLKGVEDSGAPSEVVWLMDYLFTTVLDGRNSYLTDGVQRALGREPRDFSVYANDVAATNQWRAA